MPRRRGIIVATLVALAAAVALVAVLVVHPAARPEPVTLTGGGPTEQAAVPNPGHPAERPPTLTPITPSASRPGSRDAGLPDRGSPRGGPLPGTTSVPPPSAPGRPAPHAPRDTPQGRAPSVVGDGPQAARLLGWGPVVAGDEFAGATVDSRKWTVLTGSGGAGNRVPAQVGVRGGVLTIDGSANGDTGGVAWHAGQRYGRWEARMRATRAGAGHPYRPVLQLWPDSGQVPAGCQVDYAAGTAGTPGVSAYLRYANGTAAGAQESHSTLVDLSGWHNYAVEWTPDHIAGYVDGRLWFRSTSDEVQPPGPMHQTIHLDASAPTGLAGARLDVAWVRVYKP